MTDTTAGRIAAVLPPPAGADEPPIWQRPHVLVMLLLFVGALAVGWTLLPGPNERIAMLERDGHNGQALVILEQRFAAGDHSQRTVFQLQRLYEYFGDLKRAGDTLRMLAQERPNDQQVQRQLAIFFRSTQNEAGYVATLEKQLAARYSEPACKELIGIHRRNGDFAREQATITSCRDKGYRRPDDLVRLAYLAAADGDLATSATILRSVDDRRRLKVDQDRNMLFSALLDTGQTVEAQKRALRWLKGAVDDQLALLFIDGLAHEGRHDLALGLAREVGTPGDSVSLAVAELMLDKEQLAAAQSYLRGWLEAARLRDSDVAQRFVNAALDAEDPDLAYRGAEKFGLNRMTQTDLTTLAEALSAVGLQQQFEAVRDKLDAQTLASNPLLAAAVEAGRGAAEPARQLLGRVQVDGLDEWRLALWARLMETTGQRAGATPAGAPGALTTPVPAPKAGQRGARDPRWTRWKRGLKGRGRPLNPQAKRGG